MKNLYINHLSSISPPRSRTRRAGWLCWAAAGLHALLCSLLLMTATVAVHAADQFVQVTHPGWTNSSQYSWTGAWGDYDKDGFIDLFGNYSGRFCRLRQERPTIEGVAQIFKNWKIVFAKG